MEDGSVIVTEVAAGVLTRVFPDGRKEAVAECGGGPNGAAVGPDGKLYVCNNGGFEWHEQHGLVMPGNQPADYIGGRIQRVDLDTGRVEDLYTACDGHPLRGPNDIVFDASGGFWFTDLGKMRSRDRDRTGVFYARPDGSLIREVLFPLDGGPNGIGLSPDGRRLYVAETYSGRLWAWNVPAPGTVAPAPAMGNGGTLLHTRPGMEMFDSLAVDAAGNVCVATLVNGGITIVPPSGENVRHVAMPDPLTTNICFGGPDRRTAFITLSATGRLVATEWETAGLQLAC
jgi:gluconolactonase